VLLSLLGTHSIKNKKITKKIKNRKNAKKSFSFYNKIGEAGAATWKTGHKNGRN